MPTSRTRRPSTRRNHTFNKGGFTLIEVLAATVVLTLAMGSSLIALGRGFSSLDSARSISYASQIMQSEFEKIRLTQWADILTTYTPADDEAAAKLAATTVTIDPTYYTVGDIGSRMQMTKMAYWAPGHEALTDREMVVIKLTIKWTTRDHREISRSYVTYYGKNGLYDYFRA